MGSIPDDDLRQHEGTLAVSTVRMSHQPVAFDHCRGQLRQVTTSVSHANGSTPLRLSVNADSRTLPNETQTSEMDLDETTYERLVFAIYDLAVSPSEWSAVLRLLAGALNCHYAAAIATTPDRNAPCSLGSVGITADDHREFLRVWHKHNVFGSRWPNRDAGSVVLGHSMVPRTELVRSAMYRRYLAPRAIQEIVRLDILCETEISESISLARPRSSGSFTTDELRFTRALMPHLQRAASVQMRLEAASIAVQSTLDALETVQAQMLLLDRRGRIVHASAQAERLLREADGLSADAAGLRAATTGLSARLAALIARAAGAGNKPGVSGALCLRRPSGKPDLALVAVPLRPRTTCPGEQKAAVVLQITDPLDRTTPDRALLVEAFGLTQAEAGLAVDLLSGRSVSEVATCSGRSVATVRTHLASVLAKTETTRQSDLVRLLMRLPRTAQH
jgi:DNA-binding CsgD family transcriptional regulator